MRLYSIKKKGGKKRKKKRKKWQKQTNILEENLHKRQYKRQSNKKALISWHKLAYICAWLNSAYLVEQN